jgi:excisionase family DNA binding protein
MDASEHERETLALWPEVAQRLGLSKNSVYQAAHRGEIPGCVRIGGRYLVRREPFERWLAGNEVAKPATWPQQMETRELDGILRKGKRLPLTP